MPASQLVTRRRLLVLLVVLVLVAAAVVATVTALRSNADQAADAASTASPSATSGAADGDSEPDGDTDETDGTTQGRDDAAAAATGAEPGSDAEVKPQPRKTLDPVPFDAEVTPEPGMTVTVPSVEKVTGEANLPGEVGGPALRFTVELTNGTGKTLDLRTVVVNAYYGPDRTPATPLLEPGGRAFEAEVAADGSAEGKFVFTVPPDLQGQVELEIDPGVGAPIVIFSGA